MTKKIIIQQKNQGCTRGCLVLFAWVFVVCMAIAILAYVGAIAAGIGLWFLIRYVWRQYVQQKPDSGLVQRGLKMAPITRKLLAGVLCALISLCLLGALSGMGKQNNTTGTTEQTQKQTAADNKTKDTSAKKSDSSKEADDANAEQPESKEFDTSSYSLKVEVSKPTAGQYKAIISVYGNSDADFSNMRQCIIDAAEHYEMAEDATAIGTEFDRIIGSEGGSGSTWNDGGIITSAPNETENYYRADLYVTR